MNPHPRNVLTANAKMDLEQFVSALIQRYDLTYGELTLVLTESLNTWAKYQVRSERSHAPSDRPEEPSLPTLDSSKWERELQELRVLIVHRRQKSDNRELDQPFLVGVLARQWGLPTPLHPTAARGWMLHDEAQKIAL